MSTLLQKVNSHEPILCEGDANKNHNQREGCEKSALLFLGLLFEFVHRMVVNQ